MLARPPVALRLASVPIVALVILLGVWVAGGVITDDFKGSVALTGVWFATAGAACLAIAVRSRGLRVPVLGAYLVTAAVVSVWLGVSTLRDRVVDERVATGPGRWQPAPFARASTRPSAVRPSCGPPAASVCSR